MIKIHAELKWSDIQKISTVRLFFDVDYDHPMESAHREQPWRVVLLIGVRKFRIKDQMAICYVI